MKNPIVVAGTQIINLKYLVHGEVTYINGDEQHFINKKEIRVALEQISAKGFMIE